MKYSNDLPKRMYLYFAGYSEAYGAPSFEKFARSIGVTLEELLSFKRHKRFDEAFRECTEIRRDYLIDSALSKRLDSSFTKFLLSSEYGMGEPKETDESKSLSVTLEVIP